MLKRQKQLKARAETIEAVKIHLVDSIGITQSARYMGVDKAALSRLVKRYIRLYEDLQESPGG